MNTTKVPEYGMVAEPLFEDLGESVQMKSSNTIKNGNKSTRGKKGKTSKTSVLIAKTYKLPKDLIRSMERIAYWRRLKIQDVVAEALSAYIAAVPKDDIKPMPTK